MQHSTIFWAIRTQWNNTEVADKQKGIVPQQQAQRQLQISRWALAKLTQYPFKGFLFWWSFILVLHSAATFVSGAVMQQLDKINDKTEMIIKKTKKRFKKVILRSG